MGMGCHWNQAEYWSRVRNAEKEGGGRDGTERERGGGGGGRCKATCYNALPGCKHNYFIRTSFTGLC